MIRRVQVVFLVVVLSLLSLAAEVWAHRSSHAGAPSAEARPDSAVQRVLLDAGAASTGDRPVVPHVAPGAIDADPPTGGSEALAAPTPATASTAPEARARLDPALHRAFAAVAAALAALALSLGLCWSRRATAPSARPLWRAFRGSRWAVAAALVLLVGLLAYETALHSVHHLPDSADAEACAFASAASHLAATDGGERVTALLLRPVLSGTLHPDLALAAARAHLPPRGRAPPVPLA
jgi:hypothetical protein